MRLAYKYRLQPNNCQNAIMIEWLNLCRRQYNFRLSERFNWYEATRTPVNSCPLNCVIVPVDKTFENIPEYRVQVRDGRKKGKDGNPVTKKGEKHPNIVGGYVEWQAVQLADLKNTKKKFPEYKKLHSQVLQDVVNRVEYAFSRYIHPDKNGKRSGKPRYKGLHYYKSFTYSQLTNAQLIKDSLGKDYVDLPGIGLVRILLHRAIPHGFKVKTANVKLEADGWYLTLSLENTNVLNKEDEVIHPTEANSIGIDLGLERFLTISNGDFVEIPQFLRKKSDYLAKLQRNREKHKKGSKPRKLLNKKIARLHQQIARQRLQFHFATAYLLFEKADVVFVEDLQLSNLIRKNKPKIDNDGKYLSNNQAQKSGLNKSFVDAALGQFVQTLKFVAWKLGKSVVEVAPKGTSQHCHSCLNKVPKTLSDRWHSCNCGCELHRDHNSAILIKKVGLGVTLPKASRRKEARALS
jgi:putative transposase